MTTTGHNRTLDVIASEIHGLERRNVFEIGALLAEAREGVAGDHGNWMNWVDDQGFGFSYDSAMNYF